MLTSTIAAQSALVAALLLIAGLLKTTETVLRQKHPATAAPDAISVVFGARRGRITERAIAAGEIALAAWLFSDLQATIARVLASAFLLTAAAVLVYAHARRPQAGCGCFGARNQKPITVKSVLRPTALAALCLASALANGSWTSVLSWPVAVAVLVVEAAVIYAIVPELRLAPKQDPITDRKLRKAVRAVMRSEAFQDVRHRLPSPHPSDAWVDPDNSQRVVIFDLTGNAPGVERVLAFAVEPERSKITFVGELQLTATAEGWRATHHALATA